ncbi:hypothetical protein, partial [Leisingera sp. F5]|uniref:hypothetical protein n=1 Tax=Leisingera sp. F5 TaxID=1813816 RepID=UPI0025BC50BD
PAASRLSATLLYNTSTLSSSFNIGTITEYLTATALPPFQDLRLLKLQYFSNTGSRPQYALTLAMQVNEDNS